MTAGQLRERMRFERRLQQSDDTYGNVEYAWQIIAGPVAAELTPIAGSEDILAQNLAGVQPFEVKVRWSHAMTIVNAGDRAINQRSGEIYNIVTAANLDERRQYLTMVARMGVAT